MEEKKNILEAQKIGDGDLKNIAGGEAYAPSSYSTIFCTSGVVALRDRNNLNIQIAALNCGDIVQPCGTCPFNADFTFVYAQRVAMYGYVRNVYLR